MRRTANPPKTNITVLAAALATAAFVVWMTTSAAQPDSIFNRAAPAPAASHAAGE